ncbi:Apolipoprotein N-acyltransferase [Planctomycetes bacterium MalM25]|nr:Apolipoprotein N-acyltransferase [Planctomycetes bacterium MalM25]
MLGAIALWFAQPPLACHYLAWLAPAAWLWLADHPARYGRGHYFRFWLAGALYWLLAVHWVRLPHPLTPIGWPILAAYLGAYTLAMFALVRLARRRWSVPLWFAGPIAWTGMEMLQARLFTGFLMGAVSHSQAGQPWVRSLAAWVGAYGVTFAVVLVASCLAMALRDGARRYGGWVRVTAALAAVLALGWLARSTTEIETDAGQHPLVALVQGDTRATWDPDPKRSQNIMDRQVALSAEAHRRAEAAGEAIDLVIWPESMFRSWLLTFDGSGVPPPDANESTAKMVEATNNWLRSVTTWVGGAPILVGIDRFDRRPLAGDEFATDAYNSVALADGDGELVSYYDKTHLVPFGEYIPLAKGVPALYYLTPMAGGLDAGTGPVLMRVPLRDGGELLVAPSICYETVVPRVIRRQVAEPTVRGERPDVLVNVTNDAWFWGSSELDMHLACNVFRSIETGTPMLVAANGGLSAVIDARGEVLALSPRMQEHVILERTPPKTARPTPYVLWGDWLAGGCLLACGVLVLDAARARWRSSGSRDS